MIEPAQLGINFGSAPRRRRSVEDLGAETQLLILHGSTLLDAAGEVELWARFTGRTTEDETCTRTT